MQRFPLAEDIYWIGAIDWDMRNFHGFETPRGATYNSYLIIDEKTAVIDTVREGFGPEMLRRLSGCCSVAEVDYLVVNHVEMDHSGSVPWFMEQLAPVTLVTSKRGRDALVEHYGEGVVDGWDIEVVGTGGELALGRYTLTFLEVPMVHWPDSMFTYVKEPKVLLPNDGFGQHLASAKRFADELDMNVVMEEALRYYANILMPLGNQIQKTLHKVMELGLEIDVIGPSHGVIWRRPEDIARIIEAYSAWSSFQALPKVALIYDTMWHSTEKMTKAIADGIAQEGLDCRVLNISETPRADLASAVQECAAVLIGSSTQHNQMLAPVGGFLTYLKGLRPKDRIMGAYGSYGWSGGAVKQLVAAFEELKLEVAGSLEVKYVPTEEDLAACEELGREVARRVKEKLGA